MKRLSKSNVNRIIEQSENSLNAAQMIVAILIDECTSRDVVHILARVQRRLTDEIIREQVNAITLISHSDRQSNRNEQSLADAAAEFRIYHENEDLKMLFYMTLVGALQRTVDVHEWQTCINIARANTAIALDHKNRKRA